MKNLIIPIILIALFFGGGYYFGSRNVSPEVQIVNTVDTQYIPHDSTIYKPGKTIKKDTTIYIEVPANVDTGAILKDYFAIKVYRDSLILKDSLGKIILIDTISKNSPKGRIWDYHINSKTIKETKTITIKVPYKISVGPQIGYGIGGWYIGFGMHMNLWGIK